MARKRKYTKHNDKSWVKKFDWTIDPQTGREIFAIIFFIVGILSALALFNLGGEFSNSTIELMISLFGISGFIVPLIFVALGIYFWNEKEAGIKILQIFGLVALFIFLPSLFLTKGGSIGISFSEYFLSLFGEIGGYLILVGLNIICLVLATGKRLKQIMAWIFNRGGGDKKPEKEARVSVFETVWQKISKKNGDGKVPVVRIVGDGNQVKNSFDGAWTFPTTDILQTSNTKASAGNIQKNVEIIQKSLKDFSISVTMGDVNIGPTVTQYTFKPHDGVKLNQITARSNDLSLALAAHPIRVEAPIPGKAAVGVEVPNKVSAVVTLREILESKEYSESKSGGTIPLGRDVAGIPIVVDLHKMPHLLIAGATGSGKSVCINSIILALLYQNSPNDMKLILVDPKRVEFSMYNEIPHLLCPVITEPDKTVNALKWAVNEMEKRYHILSENHKRNIVEYNQSGPAQKMPYIVVIIDELADLMVQSANEVEVAIVRIAQMARAVGIHLIVATQRPSVNVITGLIKANITSRIGFAVASQVDSRTILDQAGSEKLLGNGDMLFMSNEFGKPKRIQGVFVGEKDIHNITDFMRSQGQSSYVEDIINYRTPSKYGSTPSGVDIDDELYGEAKNIVIQANKASASLLQRRLRIGYARAARLLDILEESGIVGQQAGSKPRDVIATTERVVREPTSTTNYSSQPPIRSQIQPAPVSEEPIINQDHNVQNQSHPDQ